MGALHCIPLMRLFVEQWGNCESASVCLVRAALKIGCREGVLVELKLTFTFNFGHDQALLLPATKHSKHFINPQPCPV